MKIEKDKKEEPEQTADDLIVAEDTIKEDVGIMYFKEIFAFTSLKSCGLFVLLILTVIPVLIMISPSYIISEWASLPLEEQ